jgi:hypothetical protein
LHRKEERERLRMLEFVNMFVTKDSDSLSDIDKKLNEAKVKD